MARDESKCPVGFARGRCVEERGWSPSSHSRQASEGAAAEGATNDPQPMHMLDRLPSRFRGDAKEEIIETFEMKKSRGEKDEDQREEIEYMRDVFTDHSGSETMLKGLATPFQRSPPTRH